MKTQPIFSFLSAQNEMAQKILAFLTEKRNPAGTKQNKCVRLKIKIEPQCVLSWLSTQEQGPLLYWSDRAKEFKVAIVGMADEVIVKTSQYSAAFQKIHNQLSAAQRGVRYYGGIAFDGRNLNEEWSAFGAGHFWLPRFEIVQDKTQTIFACNLFPYRKDFPKILPSVLLQLKNLKVGNTVPQDTFKDLLFRQDHPDYASWIAIARDALDTLVSEKHQKIVLARKTIIKLMQKLNPFLFLREVEGKTKHCFCFCFQPQLGSSFLGASPERLYNRSKGKIKSEAIAGTRSRGSSNTEDEQLALELSASQKDLREHECVLEFLNKQFNLICRNFKVTEHHSILRLNEGMHLLSRLEGTLKEGLSDSDIFSKLHPTPAVGGKPNDWAVSMIAFYEPFIRGWYAGTVGWVGQDESEFAVAIRSALLKDDQLSLYSGAGIVSGSNPYSEWQEIEQKMSSFIKMFRNHEK